MGTLLMLAMMSGVNGVAPGFAKMFIAERREKFNKTEKFIRFLVNSLLNLYLWWRGVPEVKDANGNTPEAAPATFALLQQKYKDDLVYSFLRQIADDGVGLLLELMRPSAMEEALMESLLSKGGGMFSGGGSTVVLNQPAPMAKLPTATQVRAGGPGAAAQAIILPDGSIYTG